MGAVKNAKNELNRDVQAMSKAMKTASTATLITEDEQ